MKTLQKSTNSSLNTIFLSNGFVTGLIILFCNDFFFKELFHNWITGKLSDFAGLFVFAIFWAAFFPKKSKILYVAVAVFFIFWKSPLSESLIDGINTLTFLHYKRVIDWTDLIALSILPIAYFYQFQSTKFRLIKVPIIVPVLLASFLFVATSINEPPLGILIDEEFELAFPHDSLFIKLNSIDSVVLYNIDSISRGQKDFIISFYSYNCESRLMIWSSSSALTDTTCLLNLIWVNEDENCYKVADPKLVEQSMRNLILEIEDEIIDKLD
jgi:hypothetical protein